MNLYAEIRYECRDANRCSSLIKALKGQDFRRSDVKVEITSYRKVFKVRISCSDISLLRAVADSYLRYLQVVDA